MPDNPIVWIIAILALAVVVIVALWKGQMVEVDLKPPRLRFKRHGENSGGVTVGSGMTIENSTTGDIAGVKSTGVGGPVGGEGTISVAQGARITGATTGDIAGVKHAGPGDEETKC